jgi:hypothetical protein
MPIYQVTNDATGVTLELEGDRDPDQEDINRAFAFAGKQKYPNAPVLQEPPSLYEQAKSVAPSLARLAAPLAFGGPTPQDVGTAGRVLQQVSEAPGVFIDKALGRDTYRKPEEMLDAASRIEREGIMALGSASTEKRERAARIGRSLGETISEYTPIPEYVTRPAGEVFGQGAAHLAGAENDDLHRYAPLEILATVTPAKAGAQVLRLSAFPPSRDSACAERTLVRPEKRERSE